MPFAHCQRWVKSVIKFVCDSSKRFAKDMVHDACDTGKGFVQGALHVPHGSSWLPTCAFRSGFLPAHHSCALTRKSHFAPFSFFACSAGFYLVSQLCICLFMRDPYHILAIFVLFYGFNTWYMYKIYNMPEWTAVTLYNIDFFKKNITNKDFKNPESLVKIFKIIKECLTLSNCSVLWIITK